MRALQQRRCDLLSYSYSLHEPLFQPQSTITCVERTVQGNNTPIIKRQHTVTTKILKIIQKDNKKKRGQYPDKKRLVFYKNKGLNRG